MRIKIISKGTCGETEIINLDTGEALEGVRRVEWVADGKTEIAEAVLHLVDVPVEIIATVEPVKPARRSWWGFWR